MSDFRYREMVCEESCACRSELSADIQSTTLLTCWFFVPGAGIEPARPFGRGGLRLRLSVRCVRLGPPDLVTSTAVVRPCPSDPPRSDRYGRVLCRIRAGFHRCVVPPPVLPFHHGATTEAIDLTSVRLGRCDRRCGYRREHDGQRVDRRDRRPSPPPRFRPSGHRRVGTPARRTHV